MGWFRQAVFMSDRGRREFVLVAAGFVVYFGVRAVTQGSRVAAAEHARSIVRFERAVGCYWEPRLQSFTTDHGWFVTLMNWVYIWGHWPVIVLAGLWLYRSRPEGFRVTRTAFFVSGAIGMLSFVAYPVAPPRLAGSGFMDTVARYSHAYRALQPPSLVNRYAAFPSLHFGWDLLIGIALVRYARSRVARGFGILMPAAMAIAVVTTANHWVIDVVAGGVIALVGLIAATWMSRRWPSGIPTSDIYTARYDTDNGLKRRAPARLGPPGG